MNKEKKKLFLVDGHSFCYRAFYAIRELSTSSGMPTNAIYGVINMLHKLVKEYTPDMMAVVFDLKGPTVRHEKYKEYKIQRKPMPAELAAQLSGIKEVISTHNIPIYELQGFEADDIIATLARKAVGKGLDVVIVTGDKDAFQLVGDSIKVLRPQLKDNKMYDQDEVRYKYGVAPADMIELMALMGDASDNIPGVKGVGQVTARKLIEKYGTVERIYRNIDKITPAALKEKLLEGKDKASLSREL
ncbi:MAG: DNA polymerase I, partial [Candidatus Omnitrophica bacterium]|nr:DNA polymerase I [Candidatus Omnitrophota bacterium]